MANDHRPATAENGATIETRVRYAETDQMGVVYHANYLVWCEIARTELIRRMYLPYALLEERGTLLAVTEATVRYLVGARYDDLVRVTAWVREVRSRAVTFDYLIQRVDEEGETTRLATASTTLIAIGRDSRPRKLPSDLVGALSPARVQE